MNYKRILKNRNFRLKILRLLSFIPDSMMLKLQYYIQLNRRLNLDNPKRYTEKMQLYKLIYKNPLMIKCVDKYDVRSYVKDCGLESILNECYGVYEDVKDIDFDKLPNEFVLKDTLGGGGTSVIIVKDKKNFNIDKLKSTLNEWLNLPIGIPEGGREWPYYSGKKHRVIIEKFIKSDEERGLVDYKFICFDGKVHYVLVLADRIFGKKTNGAFFDKDFNMLDVSRPDLGKLKGHKHKPENFEEMVRYAELLSKPFPHARIDFYDIKGKILFGEVTFYHSSGYMQFEPDDFDYELGEKFKI